MKRLPVSAGQMTIWVVLLCAWASTAHARQHQQQQPILTWPDPSVIRTGGPLGEAINASVKGRLSTLPSWDNGELINIFKAETKDNHHKTDWYGEHAGKWLYSTAIAAQNTSDRSLKTQLLTTADALIATQEKDGYLGSYSPQVRLTNDEATHNRSWDVWNLSYTTLGLLKVNEYFPNEKYLNAAANIGELLISMFGDGQRDITQYGTRHGVSATIALDPAVELYKATQDARYLKLAETIISKMEANEGNKLVSRSRNGNDMETIGDGKAYQILWNLTALAKLYEVTGKQEYLEATEKAWENINDHHLTIGGGPWGGIGKHNECFNRKNYWSPYGYVETCSTMSWIQLNKELLRLTGQPRYAQAIETAAYNALLGAQYQNGIDWCYHSFSNGSRHIAHFNDCCPSSGALALEEMINTLYATKDNGIAINWFAPGKVSLPLSEKQTVTIEQKSNYPYEGSIDIIITPQKVAAFPVSIRIPAWAHGATLAVNGEPLQATAGEYLTITRKWKKNDHIAIDLPMQLTVHHQSERGDAPQGGKDLYDVNWIAVTRGPLVYATDGLIEGKDRERTLHLPAADIDKQFTASKNSEGITEYHLKEHNLSLKPYFMAGGRTLGSWRLTWMQNDIE